MFCIGVGVYLKNTDAFNIKPPQKIAIRQQIRYSETKAINKVIKNKTPYVVSGVLS